MTLLPDNVEYGFVTGRFLFVVPDTPDTDSFPNADPATGTVTFTARPKYLLDSTATPPATLIPLPHVATFDATGDLIDAQGNPGIYLVAPSPTLNPDGWTYTAKIETTGHTFSNEFDFELVAGGHVDLTWVSQIDGTVGNPIIRGPEGPPGPPGPSGPPDAATEARLDALEQAVYGAGPISSLRLTFDDGVEGAPVIASGQILRTNGAPITTSAAAAHGAMGMKCGNGVVTWGNVVVTALNAGKQQYSAYVTITKVGSGDCPIFYFRNSTDGLCGSIRLRSGGLVGIWDADGMVTVSTSVKWAQGDRIRIDVIQRWDGTYATPTIQVSKPSESPAPLEDPISYTFPSAMPDLVAIGTTSPAASWDVSIDTVRGSTEVSAFMAPEQPLPANLTHTFDGSFDGPMTPGVNDVIGVAGTTPLLAMAAARHGTRGVICSGALSRWTYARQVAAGTEWEQIYLRIDTVVAATPIGLLQFCTADGLPKAIIGVKSAGLLTLYPNTVGQSNGLVVAAHNVPVGAGSTYVRVAWKTEALNAGADCKLTVRSFYVAGENGEGSLFDELTYTYVGVGPLTLLKPGSELGWVVWYDTHQTFPLGPDWPPPYAPLPSLAADYSQPGRATPTTVDVASHVTGGATTARLVYSTVDAGGGAPGAPLSQLDAPITYPAGRKSVGGFVKHRVPGLTPLTRYYARLATTAGVQLGNPIRFTTLPNPGDAFTLRWVLGSCQGNAAGDYAPAAGGSPVELAWKDVLAFDPHVGFDIGDKGYWGGTLTETSDVTDVLQKYVKQQQGLPNMARARQAAAWWDLSDDHEVSGNNGDPYNSALTATKNDAMRLTFAMFDLVEVGHPIRGTYGSFKIGNQIQVILIDGYGMDRSPGAMLDNVPQVSTGAKSFLGSTQTEWLKDTWRADVAVNIVVAAKTPLGTPYGSNAAVAAKDTDKVWAYGSWFDELLADMAAARTPTAGKPIKVLWWGGDRHANAYVSAANNPRAPGLFSCMVSSGWSMHGLEPRVGEVYDYAYGFDPTGQLPVQQYLRGTLEDDPANGLVKVTAESRVTKGTAGTDPATWAIGTDTSWPGVTETYPYA